MNRKFCAKPNCELVISVHREDKDTYCRDHEYLNALTKKEY